MKIVKSDVDSLSLVNHLLTEMLKEAPTERTAIHISTLHKRIGRLRIKLLHNLGQQRLFEPAHWSAG